jgi:hypothetical protein
MKIEIDLPDDDESAVLIKEAAEDLGSFVGGVS